MFSTYCCKVREVRENGIFSFLDALRGDAKEELELDVLRGENGENGDKNDELGFDGLIGDSKGDGGAAFLRLVGASGGARDILVYNL
jgi:hypothetical protein